MVSARQYWLLGAAAVVVASASSALSLLVALMGRGGVYYLYAAGWLFIALIDYYVWRHPPGRLMAVEDPCAAMRELAELAAILYTMRSGGGDDPFIAARAASLLDRAASLRSVIAENCGAETVSGLEAIVAGDLREDTVASFLEGLAACMDSHGCVKNIVSRIDGE